MPQAKSANTTRTDAAAIVASLRQAGLKPYAGYFEGELYIGLKGPGFGSREALAVTRRLGRWLDGFPDRFDAVAGELMPRQDRAAA
jgi:hypothetical protein